jgi:hypothetical protein
MEHALVIRKSILAIVSGIVLAIITPLIHATLGSPTGDALLLGLYAVSYFPITYILCWRTTLQGCLKKAITLYYSLEFIAWVATYEAIVRFLG